MRHLLSEIKRKGLRIAAQFKECARAYSGRDDDFNVITVWVVDDSIF